MRLDRSSLSAADPQLPKGMTVMKKYLFSIGIWFLIVPLAILNGILRETLLQPLGAFSLPVSGLLLCACILCIAIQLIPRIPGLQARDTWLIGAIWFCLTNLFDLSMYLMEGQSFWAYLQTFDLSSGNLWVLVVLTSLLAPRIGFRYTVFKSASQT